MVSLLVYDAQYIGEMDNWATTALRMRGHQPPLLTEMVGEEGIQIPLLDDMIAPAPAAPAPVQIPLAMAPAAQAEKAPDALLVHLDKELRTAAQTIMQDVINDFAPHIETEIKRRLDAHMERLLAQHQS